MHAATIFVRPAHNEFVLSDSRQQEKLQKNVYAADYVHNNQL